MAKPCIKALVLITEGTEEIECTVVVDILRRAEFSVCIAGLDGKECVKCSRDVRICPDIALSDAKNNDYDIVILPGGPAYKTFIASQEVKALLEKQEKADKWIAAICASPSVLAAHGIAKGKKITSYPSVKDQIVQTGEYKYVEEITAVDGKLITSQGPGTTFDFALTIVENLGGKEIRDKLSQALLYKC